MDETPTFLRLPPSLWLDDGTVARLLDGMAADDAPPEYRGVARLLSELAAAPSVAELAQERRAVESIARQLQTAVPSPSPRRTPSPHRRATVNNRRRLRMAGAALVGSATLVMGLGAAGALPGAAQTVASDVLEGLGVTTPSPDSHAGTHPDERGQSEDTADATTVSSPDASDSNGKGADVSALATDPSLTGLEKGIAVSTLASDGKSQAGEHGAAADAQAANSGGTSTADDASDDDSESGTGTANTASDGHAADGSGNAADGQAHKP